MSGPVPKPLVIVESPAKARTIAGFLGGDFVVESSVGHIRDLPRNAADVPPALKGESWARLGVDVDSGFKPLYIVAAEKKQVVSKLKQQLKNATELYLATDEDREGESIAWHLLEVLSPPAGIPVKRMVFHEITRSAIEAAVDNWRELDRHLVDAQEARRILDRLYGYEVSPVLWKKVLPRLSAGRVQSVATRILVERERARMRFRTATYSGLDGTFGRQRREFGAALVSLNGARLATGRDFSETGAVSSESLVLLDRARADGLAAALAGAEFAVRTVDEKPYRRTPYPPFMTSTLQQEAGRKLRFSSQRTMGVAQRLYEQGYITYMRTDSTALSETAEAAARAQARELYGTDYVPDQPRRYQRKVKNAQEAHEAIRPAGDTLRTPDQVGRELGRDELALYELVWKRTIASQMADVRGRSVQVRLGATSASGDDAEFAATGKVIEFPGFLRAYVEGSDDPDGELEDREVRLPPVAPGDQLEAVAIEAKDHVTQPPARFTEASLVKALEEMGVGRPSTYASIIATVQDRGYVWKKGAALVPSFTAFAVVGLLESHFANLVDYEFTARMEDDLDGIAAGREEAQPWLSRFYFGNGQPGLHAMVSERLDSIDPKEVNSIPLGAGEDGNPIVARVGRYGPYVQREDEKAPIPDGLAPDELTVARAEELLAAPSGERALGSDPETGFPIVAKVGRYGPYVTVVPPEDGNDSSDGAKKAKKAEKPRSASLLMSMTLDSVTLDDALRLLSLPRSLGVDPSDGVEVTVQNGRYGPYVKKGDDSRSLEEEDRLFTTTLEDALALLAEPKRGRAQRAAAAPPLKELGSDPVSGAPVFVKEGRYGPYVTDGTTNASLRAGDDVGNLTLERAVELLQDRRDRGPAKKPAATKRAKVKGKGKAKRATTKRS
jgi:DNA topoisomerase-1